MPDEITIKINLMELIHLSPFLFEELLKDDEKFIRKYYNIPYHLKNWVIYSDPKMSSIVFKFSESPIKEK